MKPLLNRSASLLLACLLSVFTLHAQNDGENNWSLQRCVDYALQNNLTVQLSSLQVDQGISTLKRARQLPLPNLNGSVDGNLSDGFVIDPATNTRVQTMVLSSQVRLSSDVTIYDGGQIRNSIRRSEVESKAFELDLEASQNDITLAVVQGYVNILFQQELVESAEFQLASSKERRDRTARLVKAGAAAPAALFDIEAQIATDEVNLTNTRNQLEFAHLRLMQLLRLPLDREFGIERPSLPDPGRVENSLKPSEVYRIAESSQPNIRAADLRIQIADYELKVAKADALPSLSAFGGLNSVYASTGRRVGARTGTSPGNPFTVLIAGEEINITPLNPTFQELSYPIWNQLWDQLNWGVGASLNIPIFNRGQTVASIEQAEIQKKQAKLNAEVARQNLEQTIQQAGFDVKSSFAQYEATLKQVEALEVAFENAEKQFNLGVINSVDYILAQNNFNRANNDLIRAKYDFIFKSKILDFYAGREIKL